MITPFEVYLIMQADSFVFSFSVGAALSCTALIILVINDCETLRPYLISFFFLLLFGFLAIFTPSTKTAIAMYVMPKLANSQLVQNIPTYLQKYIEKEIKDAN